MILILIKISIGVLSIKISILPIFKIKNAKSLWKFNFLISNPNIMYKINLFFDCLEIWM